MRTVIIDDEMPSLELMKRLICKNEQLELVGAYMDSKKAVCDILRLSPDVVFADVEMPLINGMELARKIREQDAGIQIVFVTAYEKYAIEAFRVNAVNYILKPISEEDLSETVNRLIRGYRDRMSAMADERKNRIIAFADLRVHGENTNQAIQWPTTKVREIFACFVVSRGKALEKWKLCDRLWPQSPPKKAEHNLYSTINLLRNALQEVGISNIVRSEKGRYRMNLSGFSCDAWELQEFMGNNPMVTDENITDYQNILTKYQGDLFGAADYPWCIESREKYKALFLAGEKKVGRYFLAKRSGRQAEVPLQRSVQINPLDEDAVSLLIKAYFLSGRRDKMADCYEKLTAALQNELGVAPKAETARLYTKFLRSL